MVWLEQVDMESMLDLTIIIPNYNTLGLLRKNLASIYGHTTDLSFEVIVVDDNSDDGSADMVAAEFPQVRLVRNQVNQMYAKNNNLGMRMSIARYACLLNSDTEITSNAFHALVHFMDDHPDAAACGPRLVNPDGTTQHCVRTFANLPMMILQGLNWHKLFPNGAVSKTYYASTFDYSKVQVAQFISSTAFVIRRSTWEQDGMLDELFPIYQVDLAYCYTLMKKGRKLYYTPFAEVIHYGSQSVNQIAKKSLRQQHQGFIDFSNHYDYFGSSRITKRLVRWAVGIRYGIKLLELKFSKDKRVIKGPGAPRLEDAQRAAALNKSTRSMTQTDE
jgi:N-acetylglucosaminyl-diphospho-decaprenol L-rhamnosyltransferase